MKTEIYPSAYPAVLVAKNMRDLMESAYDDDLPLDSVLEPLNNMFNSVLPHYQSIYDIDTSLAETIADAAEWLDRTNELPEIAI